MVLLAAGCGSLTTSCIDFLDKEVDLSLSDERLSLSINQFNTLCELLRRYFIAGKLLYYLLKRLNLFCPCLDIFLTLHLRKVHYMHRDIL